MMNENKKFEIQLDKGMIRALIFSSIEFVKAYANDLDEMVKKYPPRRPI
jgi:hypothetical protein